MPLMLDCVVLPVSHPLSSSVTKLKHLSLCSREDVGLKSCSLNQLQDSPFLQAFNTRYSHHRRKLHLLLQTPSVVTSVLQNSYISIPFVIVLFGRSWSVCLKLIQELYVQFQTSLNLLRRYPFFLRLFFIAKTPFSLQIFMQFVVVLPAPICQFWCHLFSSTCFSKPKWICTSCILYDCTCFLGIT